VTTTRSIPVANTLTNLGSREGGWHTADSSRQTGGRSSGHGIKSLLNGKITALASTDIKFEPRFEIELAKAGEYGERTTFTSSRRSGVLRSTRTRPHRQARYRVRCAYCQRQFDRTSPSAVMRPHQDGYGNPCHGRRGYRI
jgi:hypothetical protein